MFEALTYLILIFGVAGLALGAYGIIMPRLRRLDGLLSGLPFRLLPFRLRRGPVPDDLLSDDFDAYDGSLLFDGLAGPNALRERLNLVASHVQNSAWPRFQPALAETAAERIAAPEALRVPAVAPAFEESGATAGESGVEGAAGSVLPQPEPPPATGAQQEDEDIMSLFEEISDTSRTPEALKQAVSSISARDLLGEAEELRGLLRERLRRSA
jgi:hypothetical protein